MSFHSFKVLEFDKLKEEISGNCFLEKTQEILIDLEPFKDINRIRKELENVNEFSELIKFDTGIELSGIKDLSSYYDKIDLIGSYLEVEEFFYIKENLKIFRNAKTKIDNLKDKYRSLHLKFKEVGTYKGIEDLIGNVINDEKEIKDDASLDLRDIRNNKKNINVNIKRKFDEILSNPSYEKVLQEKIITIRDGRFVVPIKTDFKGQLKGIEHDRSASGQTIFLEPLTVVSLNNKIRELQIREREEIRKILLRLTDMLRSNLEGIKEVSENILILDYINAKALYAIEKKCICPKIVDREIVKVIEARHPFINDDIVVPLTIELGKEYNILLITGPNTGGKTVALKTAGLLTLMALSGILIPAKENSEIGMFNSVFADIGDEQSIEQSLSSFSAHLKNIQKILEGANKGSLILLDELGSGTDPIEGSAFAMAVTDFLLEKKSKVIISTHYSEVKAHGYNTEGIESASMEFNSETLSPTYRLLLGIPGESNALTIARKLGLSDEIIDRAQRYIRDEDKRVESMISNIKEKSEDIDKEKQELEKLKQELDKLKKEYEYKIYQMEKEKNKIIDEAYQKSDKMVRDMQQKAKALVDKIQNEETKKQDAKETQKSLNLLRNDLLNEKAKDVKKEKKLIRKLDAKLGDKVFVKSLNQHATILKVFTAKELVQIQAGILKLTVGYDDVQKIEEKKEKRYIKIHSLKKSFVKNEIDVRGMNIDESLIDIERYMDSAVLSGYEYINIIHGKGTGKLRIGIQKFLKKSAYVSEFRDGNMNEGGLGVTVIKLK